MKVGRFTVQFNHTIAGYKTIEEVPYWRLYRIKRTKVKRYLSEQYIAMWGKVKGKDYIVHTLNYVIDKSEHNYKFDDIEYICEVMVYGFHLTKGEILVAYPRKGPTNRRF